VKRLSRGAVLVAGAGQTHNAERVLLSGSTGLGVRGAEGSPSSLAGGWGSTVSGEGVAPS
jgi:hypothetical protein